MKLGDTLKECKQFKVDKLQELLNCLTIPQLDLFNRLYPKKLNKLNEEKLNNAIDLCERTIIKNEKGR